MIATGRGGSAEYLRDERNCLIVPPQDPEAIATSARRLAGDEGLRRRVRAGGAETAPLHTEPIFNDAMTNFSARMVPPALKAYDFSGIGILVDVAGGHGAVLTSILKEHPTMRGILFDVDHVIAGVVPRIKAMTLDDRCTAISGDFFAAVPEGGDAYIMKHIIHDWDDERASAILRTIHAAGGPAARLLVLETVVPPGNEPHGAKWLDLLMLALFAGRERDEAQWRGLLDGAGFAVERIEDGLIKASWL